MRRAWVLIVVLLGLAATPAGADELRVPLSDGVTLGATLTPAAAPGPHPTVVEFSPYGADTGTLGRRAAPAAPVTTSYLAAPSLPTATDPPNAGIVGSAGANALTTAVAPLGDMTLAEKLGVSWTTKPLKHDWWAVGPAMLDVRLSSTAPETAIWAVVSDVSPDGVAHPVASGRLESSFPKVIRGRSLRRGGRIVQPYGDFTNRDPAAPGETRRYRVELWPIGNRFKAGHQIRLHLVGGSAASAPAVPGVNTVTVNGSRLLLPVLPPH